MFTFVRLAYLNFSYFFTVKTTIYPFGLKNISLPLGTLGQWTLEILNPVSQSWLSVFFCSGVDEPCEIETYS